MISSDKKVNNSTTIYIYFMLRFIYISIFVFAGFAFIQYDKTSEAASAVEGMNGRTIGRSVRPIKVTVALT